MIEFGNEICSDYPRSSNLEWLETNGIGGFASSTVSGANTRRYHGLLTAALRPPLGRLTLVSKFEETVTVDGEEFEISANQYRDTVHPLGFAFLKSFRLDPFPVWVYELAGIELERRVFMVNGENTTVCVWRVVSRVAGRDSEVSLVIKPLVSFADYHHLQHENNEFDQRFEATENCVLVQPFADSPELFFNHNAAAVSRTGHWYHGFEYPIEAERGFDAHEDLFQPFSLQYDLNEEAIAIISTKQQNYQNALEFETLETDRRNKLVEIAEPKDEFIEQLVLAADQFIVKRGEGETVIAGYPWFSDWGRDTMISLPGLTLATNREGIAKKILLEFSRHVSDGMLPNRFPDAGETPEYNTVDATLWYFEAIRAYTAKTGDYDFVKEHLYETLAEIIDWHTKGTRYGIHVDEDGLLYAGEPGCQLTWMDAKYGEEVFTPRTGKPVEIQALWYNALETICELARRFRDKKGRRRYEKMSSSARKSFNSEFWYGEGGYLYDVIDGERKDASIRPNQIFAVSLKHSMISMYKAKQIVQIIEKELFTPLGLRSLSASDPAYLGVYKGSPYERDSAYHQGTVWGWLTGPFFEALGRTYPKGRKYRQYEQRIREGFEKHMRENGIGQISEIFDGDEPHHARGCFAQAWSVAELLRVFSKC